VSEASITDVWNNRAFTEARQSRSTLYFETEVEQKMATSSGQNFRGHSEHTQSHIDSIAKQEHEVLEKRSISERVADRVAGLVGSALFVGVHAAMVLLWILVNVRGMSQHAFDPYPFTLLGTVVSLEAVFLSSFILMRQNRMRKRAERRDHLNLQIDLIAEKEITKLLQMVGAIGAHLGLEEMQNDREFKEFSKTTSVEKLTEKLENTLPES
jgi:uncharacterized membrane protein